MAMETTQVGFRMPNVLLEAIDNHVAWMQKHKPTQRYNRTDAIRELLVMGLKAFQEQQEQD